MANTRYQICVQPGGTRRGADNWHGGEKDEGRRYWVCLHFLGRDGVALKSQVRHHLLDQHQSPRLNDFTTDTPQSGQPSAFGRDVPTDAVGGTNLGKASLEIGVRPGTELQLHCNAQGKVALAFVRHLMGEWASRTNLQRHTEHTVVDPKALGEEVQQVRLNGYAMAIEEETLGICALAAPIFNGGNELVGTLAIVGTVQHIPRQPLDNQIEALRRSALRISWKGSFSGTHQN
ncbi:hypothetical protein PS673_03150 [Pseudomonas fluorescens]|uniref:IclR-ED domain-containing protein n=1 Tax=Pseudomonas fluorescens TaxID=294 RepID=A0A5E6TZ84_PSEFL|nr:hypothetical protein PS673_03150 [Pseudomonas fluorescens]